MSYLVLPILMSLVSTILLSAPGTTPNVTLCNALPLIITQSTCALSETLQ